MISAPNYMSDFMDAAKSPMVGKKEKKEKKKYNDINIKSTWFESSSDKSRYT